MSTDKMVAADTVVGITPRQEVEAVLAVFQSPNGSSPTYEQYAEVYTAIRPHCASPEDCNACALHVFQVFDNENLPRGVTKQMVVDCAIRAKGVLHTMDSLIENLIESKAPSDPYMKPPAMELFVAQALDTPVDHDIVYHDEKVEEKPVDDNVNWSGGGHDFYPDDEFQEEPPASYEDETPQDEDWGDEYDERVPTR